MRHLLIACLALLLAAAPVAAYAQSAPPPAVGVPAPAEEKPFDYFPLVVGAGAIAGVVGFNLLALGVGALPGGMAYAAPAGAAGLIMVPAEMSVAMSRVYATTSAVAGGLLAYYLYAP